MYEELVKSLRAQADYYCCHMGINSPPAMMFIEAADAIEDLDNRLNLHRQGKIGHWIPVTERLPEEKDRYLTVSIEPWFGTTVVDTMRWSGVWMYDGRQAEATVTHWMPLPQPPESEGE